MDNTSITGIILSGGQGQRLNGQDKGLLRIVNKPLIRFIIDAIKPQVETLIISANRNTTEYREFGYPVISDQSPQHLGPLAGISATLSKTETPLSLITPCDSPFLPMDLASRLLSELINNNSDIAIAHDGERLQHMYSLIRRSVLNDLNLALANNHLKVQRWMLQQQHCLVDFSDCTDCFLNINRPEDIISAEERLL